MIRTAISSLVSVITVTGIWMIIPNPGRTEEIASNQQKSDWLTPARSDRQVAQLLYPQVNERHSLRVIGQGIVKVPADVARIEFTFSRFSPIEPPEPSQETTVQARRRPNNPPKQPPPFPRIPSIPSLPLPIPPRPPSENLPSPNLPSPPATENTKPFTRETFKPIVDALVADGIPIEAIEVMTREPMEADTGKVIVKLDKPTRSRIQQIVKLVKDKASDSEIFVFQTVGVRYLVNDCAALARSAYQAAINDAKNRATAMAEAMGAQLGTVASVVEPPFYDILVTPLCSQESSSGLASFPFGFGGTSSGYDPTAPAEVQLRRDIFVTYPVR
jgi:Protein of unknown function (DUF541)